MSVNNKKILAEKIKNELNSPDYVAMPDLITNNDYYGGVIAFNLGGGDKNGWICDMRNKKQRQKGDIGKVYRSQLEPTDWEEIVNLIEKRNTEKEQIWETKRKNIGQKLNHQSNLYYYWGKGELQKDRADGWHSDKGMRGYCTFLGGNGNGLTHHLYIAENHPVLDSFSFQTGFYLINDNKPVEKLVGNYEGGFGCSGGETNQNNWQKFIEVSDQITITSYQMADKPVKKPSKIDKPIEKQPQDNSSCSLGIDKELLIKYFQSQNIKRVELTPEGNLQIEYYYISPDKNNATESKIVVSEQGINNDFHELRGVKNYLQKTNKKELSQQELSAMISANSTSTPKPKNNNALWMGGIAIALVIGVMVGFLVKNRVKKNK